MNIFVGLSVLAIVGFLNSICEGLMRPQIPLVIEVDVNEMVFVGFPNGDFYGGYLERQRVRGVPAWVSQPKPHMDKLDYIYVEMPNEVGYVTEIRYLTKRRMKGRITEFVVKIHGGAVVMGPLKEIHTRRIPEKFIHTRVYLALRDGRLFFGILERSGLKLIKGIEIVKG